MAKTIQCCGQDLDCNEFTNTCPTCGADYNWNGIRLAPREQWGAETGETAEEILSYNAMTVEELLDEEGR